MSSTKISTMLGNEVCATTGAAAKSKKPATSIKPRNWIMFIFSYMSPRATLKLRDTAQFTCYPIIIRLQSPLTKYVDAKSVHSIGRILDSLRPRMKNSFQSSNSHENDKEPEATFCTYKHPFIANSQ